MVVIEEICNSINSSSQRYKTNKLQQIHHLKFTVVGLKLIFDLFNVGNWNLGRKYKYSMIGQNSHNKQKPIRLGMIRTIAVDKISIKGITMS